MSDCGNKMIRINMYEAFTRRTFALTYFNEQCETVKFLCEMLNMYMFACLRRYLQSTHKKQKKICRVDLRKKVCKMENTP